MPRMCTSDTGSPSTSAASSSLMRSSRGCALRSASSAAKKPISSFRDFSRSIGILQPELEHAPHPGRELIGHRLVDAEHLRDDPHRDLLRVSLGRVGVAERDEPVDQRAAELSGVGLVLRHRLGREAGEDQPAGPQVLGRVAADRRCLDLCGRAVDRVPAGRHRDLARREPVDVVRDRDDVLVARRHPRAAPPFGVGHGALAAELIPDRRRISRRSPGRRCRSRSPSRAPVQSSRTNRTQMVRGTPRSTKGEFARSSPATAPMTIAAGASIAASPSSPSVVRTTCCSGRVPKRTAVTGVSATKAAGDQRGSRSPHARRRP